MWTVLQRKSVTKRTRKLPQHVLERYEQWVQIVRMSGPEGLRELPGLNDESLSGEWDGHRSSRLNLQYRVIYKIEREEVQVLVVELTAHDYRKK